MAVIKKRYTSLDECLKHLRLQIEESIKYADKVTPHFTHPANFFNWLKPQLTYKKDPRGVELLQSMPTLLNNNFYGTPGAGDCDCFTITAAACCMVQNWRTFIILAGRNKYTPVHIWSGVTINGQDYHLDFTNKIPNFTRYYPYTQKLYINEVINKQPKK